MKCVLVFLIALLVVVATGEDAECGKSALIKEPIEAITFKGVSKKGTCEYKFNCENVDEHILYLESLTALTKEGKLQRIDIKNGGSNLANASSSDGAVKYPGGKVPAAIAAKEYPQVIMELTMDAANEESTVKVNMKLACRPPPSAPDHGGFGTIFAAYILPFIVVAIILVLAAVRWCRPDLTASVKRWAGFKELDDESRTRHTKVKDKAGGGTWIDHADKVVTDLQKAKVDKLEARNEQELQELNDSRSHASHASAPLVAGGGREGAGSSVASGNNDNKKPSNDEDDDDF